MLKTVGFPSIRTGDQTIVNGNLVIGTAGKGIDFSADPSAPGMTSQLLDDYEEGTWTPAYSSSGASFPYDLQSGVYIKIGRFVYASFSLNTGSAATGTLTNSLSITGLPFTSATYGSVYETWGNFSITVAGIVSSTSALLYQQGTITAATPVTTGLSAGGKYFSGMIIYSV